MAVRKEVLVDMYEKMTLIRAFEDKVHELFAAGKIPGFVHLYAGEEAVAVGVCAHLRKEDYITSTHRGHGHCIAKGCDVKYMMAELFCKETGYCKGKGGSMHIADVEIGMLGANGIVGAGGPLAVGAGLSIKLRKTDNVVACFAGDGAFNQGTIQESMNLASIWKLPVIFVCENNMYAISMRSTAPTALQPRWSTARDISDRAAGYGIPAVTIDGNDVMAVYEAAAEAVKRAREGMGPSVIVCNTYRYYGHFEGDPMVYRSREEEAEAKKNDPIMRFRAKLIGMGTLTEKEAKAIEEASRKKVGEAVKFAEESPPVKPEEAYTDIFVSPYY
jgi:pyruvate dehydrogenase E1 component alpha subunit